MREAFVLVKYYCFYLYFSLFYLPPRFITSDLLGDKGKQLEPGNNGLLSKNVPAFSFNIPIIIIIQFKKTL